MDRAQLGGMANEDIQIRAGFLQLGTVQELRSEGGFEPRLAVVEPLDADDRLRVAIFGVLVRRVREPTEHCRPDLKTLTSRPSG